MARQSIYRSSSYHVSARRTDREGYQLHDATIVRRVRRGQEFENRREAIDGDAGRRFEELPTEIYRNEIDGQVSPRKGSARRRRMG